MSCVSVIIQLLSEFYIGDYYGNPSGNVPSTAQQLFFGGEGMALMGSSLMLSLLQHSSTNGSITGCTIQQITQQNTALEVNNLLYLNDGIQLIYAPDNHFMLDTNLKEKKNHKTILKVGTPGLFKCRGYADQFLTVSKNNVR